MLFLILVASKSVSSVRQRGCASELFTRGCDELTINFDCHRPRVISGIRWVLTGSKEDIRCFGSCGYGNLLRPATYSNSLSSSKTDPVIVIHNIVTWIIRAEVVFNNVSWSRRRSAFFRARDKHCA